MTGMDQGAEGSPRLRLSRRAILLAASTSIAVLAAWTLGSLSLPVVVLVTCAGCTVAAFSIWDSRPLSRPYTLQPLAGDQDEPSTPVIAAPRARDLASARNPYVSCSRRAVTAGPNGAP